MARVHDDNRLFSVYLLAPPPLQCIHCHVRTVR